jgi:hypothetical protein
LLPSFWPPNCVTESISIPYAIILKNSKYRELIWRLSRELDLSNKLEKVNKCGW